MSPHPTPLNPSAPRFPPHITPHPTYNTTPKPQNAPKNRNRGPVYPKPQLILTFTPPGCIESTSCITPNVMFDGHLDLREGINYKQYSKFDSWFFYLSEKNFKCQREKKVNYDVVIAPPGCIVLKRCITPKLNDWWSPAIVSSCMTPIFPTFILQTWNRTLFLMTLTSP